MITSLFLPEKIGSYYLLKKRIAAIDISGNTIYAAVSLISGKQRIIEKIIQEPIITDAQISYDDRVINALKNLAPKLGSFNELCYVLPSALVVFKDMKLPFKGIKKIKLVVPFEVEPLLPFTLDQAVVDCIITHQDGVNEQTDIVVAAIKHDVLARYENYFKAAGLTLTKVSVDIFELYGLYKATLTEQTEKKSVALVDIGQTITRVGMVVQGQLKYVRSIARGIESITNKIVPTEDVSDAKQELIAQLNSDSIDPQVFQSSKTLFDEILFTIDGYIQKDRLENESIKMILFGSVTDIPHIEKIIPKTALEVEVVKPATFLSSSSLDIKPSEVPGESLITIAAATSQNVTSDFTLLQEEAQNRQNKLLSAQLLTIAGLIAGLFLFFATYSFFRVRTLRLAVKDAQNEAINELKKTFKLKQPQVVNLAAANKAAQAELKKQETAWSHLSAENRSSYLRYLRELSRCLSAKETQLELTSLHIKDDTIRLYGSVPGYQQLTKFQNQLDECTLFKKLPKLQNWNFKSEPITLVVNREEN